MYVPSRYLVKWYTSMPLVMGPGEGQFDSESSLREGCTLARARALMRLLWQVLKKRSELIENMSRLLCLSNPAMLSSRSCLKPSFHNTHCV
jgi:hypothetical protein